MKNLIHPMNNSNDAKSKTVLFRTLLIVYLLFLGLLALLSTGCKKDKADTAAMEVMMTDAPAEFLNVYVDVKEVRIRYVTNDTNDTSSTSGWVTLNTNAQVYDLLELRNDLTVALANKMDLPVGRVNQIRLVLGSNNYVVTKDSIAFPLVIPSSSESGLKIQTNILLEAGTTTVIVVDFDAEASVREQVGGYYRMSPVIHLKSSMKK